MVELNFEDETVETVEEEAENRIVENKLLDMDIDEYHSKSEYLSASNIKTLHKEPYEYFHPKEQKDRSVFALGSAIHKIILEKDDFFNEFIVAPKVDKRTKAGKEEWKNFLEDVGDKTVLKFEDYEMVKSLEKTVMDIPEVLSLFRNGVAEKSYFSRLEDGTKVKCRPDYYIPKRKLIIDIKSCVSSRADRFKKDIVSYGYDIQAEWYMRILDAEEFLFFAVEKEAPFMCGIYIIVKEELATAKKSIQISLKRQKQSENYLNPLRRGADGLSHQYISLPVYNQYANEDN